MKPARVSLALILAAAWIGNLAQADPKSYAIDNDHTHIVWQVDRFGFADTVGTFVDVSGTLTLDQQAVDNSTVQAAIELAGLRSDLAEREESVLSSYWLDAASHPEILFRSTQVSPTAEADCDCLVVTGDMTLRGVTRPLALEVTINKTGTDPVSKRAAAGFTARGSFRRSEFGMTTALGPIGDTVSFEIQALAIEVE